MNTNLAKNNLQTVELNPERHHCLALEYTTCPPANLYYRLVAYGIDCIFIEVAIQTLTFLNAHFFGGEGLTRNSVSLLMYPLMIIYSCYSIRKFGYTPGKYALGLRVIQPFNGKNPTFFKLIIREGPGKFLGFLTLGIGFIISVFRKDKRTLYDLLTGTQVVHDDVELREFIK